MYAGPLTSLERVNFYLTLAMISDSCFAYYIIHSINTTNDSRIYRETMIGSFIDIYPNFLCEPLFLKVKRK